MQKGERIEAGPRRRRVEALDAFIARNGEIDSMLRRLTELSADHFGVELNDVDWARVGTLAYYAQLLAPAKRQRLPGGRYTA